MINSDVQARPDPGFFFSNKQKTFKFKYSSPSPPLLDNSNMLVMSFECTSVFLDSLQV